MVGPTQETGGVERGGEVPAKRGEVLRELEGAHRRLTGLYEVSKLLNSFQSLERTVPDVMAVVGQTLPLHNAIFILGATTTPRTILWRARSESAPPLREASAHAQAAYRSLVGGHFDLELDLDDPAALGPILRGPDKTEQENPTKKAFVMLPLVVGHGAIFGALQVERFGPWVEQDLMFLNAAVNQIAIAVDRQAIVNARQATAEASEKEQRMLAEVSAVVGSSLGYRDTLAAITRFVVPVLADLCVIDEVVEDGTVQRREVRFADPKKQQDISDQVRRSSPQPGWQTPQAKVIASGKSFLFSTIVEPMAEGIAHDQAHARTMLASGIKSMMAVPLTARGNILGVLTLCALESDRHYTDQDLAFAEEIARRAAVAVDNARLYEQAQRSTVARDNLLSAVSHDLRNPLTVILMNLSALLKLPESEDRRGSRKYLDSSVRAAQRMNRMIGDLLQTARIEAGRLSMEQRSLEVPPLVAEAIEALQFVAVEKSLRLTCELPAALPPVHGDSARLQQVLANLLDNAIKFTNRGDTIVVRAQPSETAVTFSVTDTGSGIDEDALPHLFDRFWQAKGTARLGTGLGLFIVKGIVEAHGGRVWVESQLHQGSTFFFTIPLSSAPSDVGNTGQAPAPGQPPGPAEG